MGGSSVHSDVGDRIRMWSLPVPLLVVSILAVATIVRLHGIDQQGITHTELYVPGIPLPPEAQVPPARTTFLETLRFHFRTEAHPMGWYLMMFGWTKFAGTSLWALRLPSAIFGVATILALFALVRVSWGIRAALLSSLMLALHGFHVFESQDARMYIAGTFWCVLSSYLLFLIVRRQGEGTWVQILYVLSTFAALSATELSWLVLLMQMLWATLRLPKGATRGTTGLLQLQSVILIFGAVELMHSVACARNGAVGPPTFAFLLEYLSFGFIFAADENALPIRSVGLPLLVGLSLASSILLAIGLRRGAPGPTLREVHFELPRAVAPTLAIAVAVLMIWLSQVAARRNDLLLVMSVLPIVALLLPSFGLFMAGFMSRRFPMATDALRRADGLALLALLVGVVAPLSAFLASFIVPVAEPRTFLIFVPFLLLLVARGIEAVGQSGPTRALAGAAVVAILAASIPFNLSRVNSPRDYGAISDLVRSNFRDGDVLFIREANWADAPLLYELGQLPLADRDFDRVVADPGTRRIWLVKWEDRSGVIRPDARLDALAGQTPVAVTPVLRGEVRLYDLGRGP